jgi:hypothetical protein
VIVCRKCRASNADADAFCGSCGAFLEWTGEQVTPAAAAEPEHAPKPAEPTARPGLLERVQHAVGAAVAPAPAREDKGKAWTGLGNTASGSGLGGSGGSSGSGGAASASKPAPGQGPAAPSVAKKAAPQKAAPKPPASPSDETSAGTQQSAPAEPLPPADGPGPVPTRELADPDAAGLVVDVSDSRASAIAEQKDPATEGVLPQRVPTRVAPVTRTKPTRRLQAGDLICGQCGEGNPPTRKFCSRCGESLTTAEVVRARWYTKLMFWRHGPNTLVAGTRTGQQGEPSNRRAAIGQTYRRVRNAIAGLMLLSSVLYVVVPPLRTPVDRVLEPPVSAVRDWIDRMWQKLTASTVTLPPNRAGASAELPGHKAGAAFDNDTNSFWAAPWSPKRPPSLTVRYDKAVDLVAFAVHAGAPGEDDSAYLHPRQLVIRYGSGRTDTIELTATGDAQVGDLDQATSFRFARITITKVYVEDGLHDVALSEVELKEQK